MLQKFSIKWIDTDVDKRMQLELCITPLTPKYYIGVSYYISSDINVIANSHLLMIPLNQNTWCRNGGKLHALWDWDSISSKIKNQKSLGIFNLNWLHVIYYRKLFLFSWKMLFLPSYVLLSLNNHFLLNIWFFMFIYLGKKNQISCKN